MGFKDTSLICKIVFILLILCFILDLIGFAIPYWYSTYVTELGYLVKSYGGLWVVCGGNELVKACLNLDSFVDVRSWLKAVRAFSILSWLCFLAALVLLSRFMFVVSDKKIIYLGAIGLSCGGAFCALIAFAVYAGNAELVWKEYSAGFALTIIAFILGLIIGVLGFVDFLKKERENRGIVNK